MARNAIDYIGLDSMAEGFKKLEAYAYKTVFNDALKEAAKEVTEAAKSLVPVKSGATKNAIRVRAGRSGRGTFTMLASIGKRNFVGDEFYGAFQEFGWKHGGRLGRKSPNRKSIPGEHFMQYAFESRKSALLTQIMRRIKEGLDRELAN